MSDTVFEQFMTRLTLREHTYLVYDGDVCIGEVKAVNDIDACNQACAKFNFTHEATFYLQKID